MKQISYRNKFIDKLIFDNVDIAIITSADIEFKSVYSKLKNFCVPNIINSRFSFVDNDQMRYNFGSMCGFNVCLIQTGETGIATQHGAVYSVSALLKLMKPQAFLMLGVCCDMDDTDKSNKVYVSNAITYYEYAKYDQRYLPRGIVERPYKILNIFTEELGGENYIVKKGEYLCGEKVLKNESFKTMLQEIFPGAVALDMESYAFVLCAHDIPHVVIKGASDNGINKEGSNGQEEMMSMVIDYVQRCLKNAKKRNMLSPKYTSIPILISGADDCVDQTIKEQFLNNLCMKFYDNNFRLINGYGKGIGEYLLVYSKMWALNHGKNYNDLIVFNPFPINLQTVNRSQYKILAQNTRHELCGDSLISVFIYGNKGDYILAEGVKDEYAVSYEFENIVVPLAATGYQSKNIYDEYLPVIMSSRDKELIKSYKKLNSAIALKDVKNIESYINNIIQYIFYALKYRMDSFLK